MVKAEVSRDTDGRPRLVHSVELGVPITRAWEYVVDPDFTKQYFFGYLLRTDLRAGAGFVFETPEGHTTLKGELLTVDAPNRLVMSARILRDAETAGDAPSRITWELESLDNERCVLTVVHDQFETETATFELVRNGWPEAMAALEALAARDTAA